MVGSDIFGRLLMYFTLRSDEHARIMKECFETMTPTEIKWLIRIILKGTIFSPYFIR